MNTTANSGKRRRTILWLIFAITAIVWIAWGQLSVRRSQQRADSELAAAQTELARIEKVIADHKLKLDENRGLKTQLQDDRQAFSRVLRSFKRPRMRKTLLEQLQLPVKNCVVSSQLTISDNPRELLIYSTDSDQQLVIPVWIETEPKQKIVSRPNELDTDKLEPKHKVVIDVPSGELNILEFGVVEEPRKDPYFIVRFAEQEHLKIDLPKSDGGGKMGHGWQASSLLLPNVISRKFTFEQSDNLLELLSQGIWLRQHEIHAFLTHSDKDVTTRVSYCLYWKSSRPLYTDGVLPSLPLEVQLDLDTGLYQITPPTQTEP